VFALDPGRPFELHDDRAQSAVLVMRRAEVAQARVRLACDPLLEGGGQARLADARLARNQNDAPAAALGLLPSAGQQLELLPAADKRGQGRAPVQRVEAALQ